MTGQKTIVIIEDEIDTAEMFGEMMRLTGYKVNKFYNGMRALASIADNKPAAVILDLMMPDFSGLEVLSLMRRDPQLANIPVVIVSAKSLPADIQTGLEYGATLYLTKPVSFRDLVHAVNQVTGQVCQ